MNDISQDPNVRQGFQDRETPGNESSTKWYTKWYVLSGIVLFVGIGVASASFLFIQDPKGETSFAISDELTIQNNEGGTGFNTNVQSHTYTNAERSFSFLYPNEWMLTREGGKEVFYHGSERIASITCPIREVGYEAWDVTTQEKENVKLRHLEAREQNFDDFSLIFIQRDEWKDTCEISIKWTDEMGKEIAEGMYESVEIDMVPTGVSNVITKEGWGVSFQKSSAWSLVSSMPDYVILKNDSQDDTIRIDYVTGPVTTEDATFGDRTFRYDTQAQSWMRTGQYSETQGIQESAWVDVESFTTQNGLEVFTGTTRWLTYVVPLKDGEQEETLRLNITGTGETQALKDLIQTLEVM